jgi:hypothetical protein
MGTHPLRALEERMPFSLAPLLIHDPAVPPRAREALRASTWGPAEDREKALELAARVIYHETDLDCAEARDLVGLERGCCA